MNQSNASTATQTKIRWRWGLLILAIAIVISGGAILWISLPKDDAPSAALPSREEVDIDPQFGAVVPSDLMFRDESGQPTQLGQLLSEKPVILAPVYFQCPMLCNMTMDGLVRGLRGLSADVGSDFTVITVSFDPQEGPQLAAAAKATAMTRYGRPGAAAGWHFLTGEQEPISALTDAIGFRYKLDEASGQYMHAAGLFVLTPDGEISRFLGGVEFTPRDLKLAITEASAGRTMSFTDQVLLLCFHYDPAEGKYGLAIMRMVRFAGLVTVAGMAVGIVVMIRREGQGELAHWAKESIDE